jgi:hypothetical protein
MIKKLFILCFILVVSASCETYKDYVIDYSPVYPLSGEWLVRFTDTSVTPSTSGLFVMSTYNTADNSSTQMWIRVTSTSATAANIAYTGRFTGKISCDVAAKTFSGANALNTYYTTGTIPTFTITNGTVLKDGYDTATGGKSDKITFTITDTRKPGKTITVSGFRRTRWLDDEV